MNISEDIQTLSDFKQNASKFVKRVQETKQPLVLTVNGKPAVVIQDPESYQQMADSRDFNETVAVLRKRTADLENYEQWPTHKEGFDEIRQRFDIEHD
ncbi:hypothetical protein BH10ACI3_BH10ACI3_05020 [soil metagenome]